MNDKKQIIAIMVAKIALFPLGVYLQLQYTLGGFYGESSRWYNFGVHGWVEQAGFSPKGSFVLAIIGGVLLLILEWPKNEYSKVEIIWMYFVGASSVVLGILMGVKMSWIAGGIGIIISVTYTWALHGVFGKDVLFNRSKENQTEDIKQSKYDTAINEKIDAISESDYGKAADLFEELGDYKDSKQMRIVCLQLAGDEKCSEIYNNAKLKMASNKKKDLTDAINMFKDISHWEDSKEQIDKCRQLMKKKRRTSIIIIIAIICLFSAGIVFAYKINESREQATLEKAKPVTEQKEESVDEKNSNADNLAKIINNDRFVITRGELEKQIKNKFKKIDPSTEDITDKDDYFLTYNIENKRIIVKITNYDEPITNNDVIKCLIVIGKHGEENGKYYAAVASLLGDGVDNSSLALEMDEGMNEMMKNKETKWKMESLLEDYAIYYAVITKGKLKGLEMCAFFSKEMDINSALEKYTNQL